MGDRPTDLQSTAAAQTPPILVTGFGPFRHHTVNASWVAVQELKRLGLEHKSHPVPLEIREVQVAYDVVTSTIPQLYEEVGPRLCVHVGVSPYKCVKLEKSGKNYNYQLTDVKGNVPASSTCVPGGPPVIRTTLDVDKACRCASSKQPDVKFDVSNDAGRYLCDFIYYTSLYHKKAPVVFVHVPELEKPYSAAQLALALKHIIEALIEDLETGESSDT